MMKNITWTLDESPAQQILRMIPRKQAGPHHRESSSDRKSPDLRGQKHVPQKNFAANATSTIDTIDTTYLYAGLTLHHSLPRSGTQSAYGKKVFGKEKQEGAPRWTNLVHSLGSATGIDSHPCENKHTGATTDKVHGLNQ